MGSGYGFGIFVSDRFVGEITLSSIQRGPFQNAFVANESGLSKPDIVELTNHYYPRAACGGTPPTIVECENYGGRTFNELFRYHSRHADIFRYGSEGDSTRLRPEYGVNPEAVYHNAEYN